VYLSKYACAKIANAFGGWALPWEGKGGSLIEYFDDYPALLSIAARIMGGYKFPDIVYELPSLDCIILEEEGLNDLVANFLSQVLYLQKRHVSLQKNGASYEFVKIIFATFLMRFPKVI